MREVLASYLGRILSPNFWATMILTWSAELIRSSNKGINSLPKDNWSLSLVLQITAGNSKTQEQWWVLISPWCAHSRSSKPQRKRSDGKIYYLEWKIVKILLLIRYQSYYFFISTTFLSFFSPTLSNPSFLFYYSLFLAYFMNFSFVLTISSLWEFKTSFYSTKL